MWVSSPPPPPPPLATCQPVSMRLDSLQCRGRRAGLLHRAVCSAPHAALPAPSSLLAVCARRCLSVCMRMSCALDKLVAPGAACCLSCAADHRRGAAGRGEGTAAGSGLRRRGGEGRRPRASTQGFSADRQRQTVRRRLNRSGRRRVCLPTYRPEDRPSHVRPHTGQQPMVTVPGAAQTVAHTQQTTSQRKTAK